MSSTQSASIPGGVKATSGQLAAMLKGELRGPADVVLSGFGPIDAAGPGDLTFIRSDRYALQWAGSRAGAAVVSRAVRAPEAAPGRALIIVDDADLAMITLMNMLAPPVAAGDRASQGSIHPTAVIDEGVRAALPGSVVVGPGCVVGARTVLGEGVKLVARVSIGSDVRIGTGTLVHPGAVVYDGCHIGDRCVLLANCVIGADGFGFRPSTDGRPPVKVPHMSNAVLGDDVQIGAGTCVDRGRLRPTIVGSGTKIDNLVQVGHGVQIGANTLIAGCVGIAGSVTIGTNVLIGGHCGIADNITIGDGARLGGCTGLFRDVPAGATYLGLPGQPVREILRQWSTTRKLAGLTDRGTERGGGA